MSGQKAVQKVSVCTSTLKSTHLFSCHSLSWVGLFLIITLNIIAHIPGRTASVVITCVAVFCYATQLAVWCDLSRFVERKGSPPLRKFGIASFNFGSFEPKDIIAATVAYAAILVVLLVRA